MSIPGQPTLAQQLSQPITSVDHLLGLLLAQLDKLGLVLASEQDLIRRYLPRPARSAADPTPGPSDNTRSNEQWLRRQLGLVQRSVIVSVYPDWSEAIRAEGGDELVELALGRWFISPTNQAPIPVNSPGYAGRVTLSGYSVISALLSSRRPLALLPPSTTATDSATSPSTSSPTSLHPHSLTYALTLLERLLTTFSLPDIWDEVYGAAGLSGVATSPANGEADTDDSSDEDDHETSLRNERWEGAVKDVFGLATRVANACGVGRMDPPPGLEYTNYLASLTLAYHRLLLRHSHSPHPPRSATLAQLALPLSHLSSFFPPAPANSPTPSFFSTLLPALIPALLPPATFPTPAAELLQRRRLRHLWAAVWLELSPRELERGLRALASELEARLLGGLAGLQVSEAAIQGVAFVLGAVMGTPRPASAKLDDNAALWAAVEAVFLDPARPWSVAMAKAVVLWVTGDGVEDSDRQASRLGMVEAAMGAWVGQDGLKQVSTASRVYLTALLLFSIDALPPHDPTLIKLSHSPPFLSAVSAHLGLINQTTRLMGMLVAEEMSRKTVGGAPGSTVQPLLFGAEVWQGEGEGREVARRLRGMLGSGAVPQKELVSLLEAAWAHGKVPQPARPPPVKSTTPRPAPPAEDKVPPRRPLISLISDDGDDLQAYPLPPEPPAAVLEALDSSDPSLYATALPNSSQSSRAIRPPVYIQDLIAYLKAQDPARVNPQEAGAEERQAQLVEVGLEHGEALVRRKAGWGGELRENAVELVFALVGLQDNYEVDGFDRKKVGILSALVWAEPERATPALIEQYFTPHYSISQRHAILTAIAVGARELSGFPSPLASTSAAIAPAPDTSFPSKRLPPALHRRLLPDAPDAARATVLDELTGALAKSALEEARSDGEQAVPEASKTRLLTVRQSQPKAINGGVAGTERASFASLAAEFFVLPLVNRFYLHLRDLATSSASATRGTYAGGRGADPILSPIPLSQFLQTLALLMHAARHSPHFLAVLAPDALGLCLALRPVDAEVEAGVMECFLAVLQGCVALDGGRELMTGGSGSGGEVVGEVREWAEGVFEREEGRGALGRAGRAAAGVLLRVEEVMEKGRVRLGW